MKNLKLIVVSLSIFFFTQCVYSQNYTRGYIVQNNGDTLRGLVRWVDLSDSRIQRCLFKYKRSDKPEIFNANNIRGYGYDNDRYMESVLQQPEADGKPKRLFMLSLLVGEVSLYALYSVFYLKKGDGFPIKLEVIKRNVTVNDKQYIEVNPIFQRVISRLISSACPTINYKKNTPEEDDLIAFLKQYHECVNKPYRLTASKMDWFQFRPTVGLVANSLSFDEPVPVTNFRVVTTANRTISFASPLIGFEIKSPRASRLASIGIESGYLSISQSVILNPDYPKTATFRTNWVHNYDFIRLKPYIKYVFLTSPSTPYIKLHFVYNSILKQNATATYDYTPFGRPNEIVTISTENQVSIRRYAYGYGAAVGFSSAFGAGFGFVECQYESSDMFYTAANDIGGNYLIDSKFKGVSIVVGYRF